MADLTIYLGNKNYSSWSLRAWLALKRTTVAFDEIVVPLKAGRNELLFRVTQFGGAYAFGLKLRIEDYTRVYVVG